MDSLRLRNWKYFCLGWWNALASAWFLQASTILKSWHWIQLRLGLRDRAWEATNGNSRKLAHLSLTIFSKFWSWDCYPFGIYGSQVRCSTGIAEQVTSEVVDIMFSQAALSLSFHKHRHICKRPNLLIQLRRQCFISLAQDVNADVKASFQLDLPSKWR